MDHAAATAFLNQQGLTITESQTTPKRRGKQPKPVWLVTGRVAPFRSVLYDLGGNTRFTGRNTFSFWDDPTVELAEAIEEQGEETLEVQVEARNQRSAQRAQRYQERAVKQRAEGEAAYRRSNAAVEGISVGQPILVGHHSEKGHRRALNRAHKAMDQSVAAARTAEELSQRAAGSEGQIRHRQSKEYIGNRLKEAEANQQEAQRLLDRYPNHTRYQLQLQDAQAAIAHWQQALAAAGGVLTRADIAKGDWVQYSHTWYEVLRVNAKSVTIKGWLGVETMTWRAEYHKIQAHVSRAQRQEKERKE